MQTVEREANHCTGPYPGKSIWVWDWETETDVEWELFIRIESEKSKLKLYRVIRETLSPSKSTVQRETSYGTIKEQHGPKMNSVVGSASGIS